MKTKMDFSIFGIFIPKGSPVVATESCAVVARYDESAGCRFDKKMKYIKPQQNAAIAIPLSYI